MGGMKYGPGPLPPPRNLYTLQLPEEVQFTKIECLPLPANLSAGEGYLVGCDGQGTRLYRDATAELTALHARLATAEQERDEALEREGQTEKQCDLLRALAKNALDQRDASWAREGRLKRLLAEGHSLFNEFCCDGCCDSCCDDCGGGRCEELSELADCVVAEWKMEVSKILSASPEPDTAQGEGAVNG